jgi:hypothetical protein
MSTKTYLFHERSSIFPLIEGEAFDGLVEDIKKFGQLEDGVLFKGKILDGRNRYRACKILKIPFRAKEYSGKMDPLDYIISQNLHRRHLNIAQRSEIGLLLLEEEEKLAKERTIEIKKEQAKIKIQKGKQGTQKIDSESKFLDVQSKIDKIKKEKGEGSSVVKVAPRVKISSVTLTKAKKIKKVAEKDPEIKKEWNKALKGEIGVDKVYQEVRKKEIIEKLPEELKEEVKKKELTVKEAKDVAESFKEPEMRKEAIKTIKKEKKEHERTMDYIKKVGTGEAKLPKKVYMDINQRIVKQFQDIGKQIVLKMTMNNVKGYNEKTQPILIKIMKKCLEHLQNELDIKGGIISV